MALLPFLFVRTGSRAIAELNERMIANRRGTAAAARRAPPAAAVAVGALDRALSPRWAALRQAAPGVIVAIVLALLARAMAQRSPTAPAGCRGFP